MITIKGQTAVYIDIDQTLMRWLPEQHEIDSHGIEYYDDNGMLHHYVPHKKHIAQLKEHKSRGTTVVLWSAAGSEWAAKAARILGIESWVDVCLSKPNWVFDDLPIEDFMPKSRWLKDPHFKEEVRIKDVSKD